MRHLALYILLLYSYIYPIHIYPQNKREQLELEKQYDVILLNEELYSKQKNETINQLKALSNQLNLSNKELFKINYQLFNTYKKFQSDSALIYINKCKSLLSEKNSPLHTDIQLDIAAIYSTNGQYIASKNILNSIDRKSINKELLPKYYEVYGSFYSRYGQSNNEVDFYKKSELYRDSLLSILDTNSVKYKLTLSIKNIFSNKTLEAKTILHQLINFQNIDAEQKALIAYFLGLVYKSENNIDLQKYYLTLSAIIDIQTSNKDNASLQDLALTYYQLGQIERAYKTIDHALRDAIFCNVRYRLVEATYFYPIINTAYQAKINDQNKKLLINIIIVSILTLILIIGCIFIIIQNSKLKLIKNQLSKTNNKLLLLNKEINKNNSDLRESNHIKEEYIAQFFDMCSTYIEKIDKLQKSILKKANNNQMTEVIAVLKSNTLIEQEISDLYLNFDTIFLNLYPNFVEDFNSLLKENERIYPKKGELLNTEIRVFALIRLGIDDSVKIANFLRYSIRTVYNYRTKVRNKSRVNRDEFESLVKKIGEINR